MNQPIHKTLVPKERPKRFELTWEMIEWLSAKAFDPNVRTDQVATALEIILQCKTFAPGVFDFIGDKWVRAGSETKHENLEGC